MGVAYENTDGWNCSKFKIICTTNKSQKDNTSVINKMQTENLKQLR